MPKLLTSGQENDLIKFTQELVRIKSLPGNEGEVIHFIHEKMLSLGYDEVVQDSMGSLFGRLGSGASSILFDSHVDTVDVTDAESWTQDPFGGEIVGGRLCGCGSVDMKGGAAASIFAPVVAKQSGLLEGKTVYVSLTTYEEDCDGDTLKHLLQERSFNPDYVVICEPSNNTITLGHKGKAQAVLRTFGVSAHGSAPEKGVNAVYEMAEIIHRVERTNLALKQKDPPGGTLVLSRISSKAASLNAVPSECEIYLDRRMEPGETEAAVRAEMDALVEDKRAAWEIGTLHRRTRTGEPISYVPFHLAWKLDPSSKLAQACIAAYREYFGVVPAEFGFWDFSTNAVAPVSLGIPTIGFGPGDPKLAHMRDESIPLSQIIDACEFYARLVGEIPK